MHPIHPTTTMMKLSARSMKSPLLITLAALVTVSISGCSVSKLFSGAPATAETATESGSIATKVQQSKLLGVVPVYRPDVQQGNFISKEMVAQLKVGMTPDQVRFVLGTPLLNDLFHETRWDYPFRLIKGDGDITSSRVVVFFKEGRVSHFEGGDLPDEKDYLRRIAAPPSK